MLSKGGFHKASACCALLGCWLGSWHREHAACRGLVPGWHVSFCPWSACVHVCRPPAASPATEPQLGEMWGGPKSEDTDYVRVKAMLKSLGLSVSMAVCLCAGGNLAPPVVFQGLAISTSTGCPAGALLSSPASCAALPASCHVASSSCGKRYACHCFLCCPSGLTFPPACRRSSAPQQYEKNVRKGLLNDATIGLWDTAALQVRRLSGMLLQGSLLVTWSGCVVRCCLCCRFTCLALPYQHARTTSRKCILTTCWRPKPTYNCVPLLLFSEYAGGAHPRRPAAAHPGPHRPVPSHPAASHARAQGTAARVDCVSSGCSPSAAAAGGWHTAAA